MANAVKSQLSNTRQPSDLTILDAINHVMYTEYGFDGNTEDYYNEHNSFIDKVKIFSPIKQCVVKLALYLILSHFQWSFSVKKYNLITESLKW